MAKHHWLYSSTKMLGLCKYSCEVLWFTVENSKQGCYLRNKVTVIMGRKTSKLFLSYYNICRLYTVGYVGCVSMCMCVYLLFKR